MSFFFCCKHLIFISFIFSLLINNQLIEAQIMEMDPNLDQSLLPFGSIANIGSGFMRSCGSIPSGGFPTFTVLNNCSYTVWAAANPGGGRRLDSRQTWFLNLRPTGTTTGRIWGRTNCKFDSSERGSCETGDCGGVLRCQTNGSPPNTVAEFALNQISDLDFFDISLVDGFNIPMEFRPTSNGCSNSIRCTADINGQCPLALKVAGGCNGPCTVFQTEEYCCITNRENCGPTGYSKFFKERCPDAYSYPTDDATSTFTCPAIGGTKYDVVFCAH
ncbi:protein P21-like [Benincasa hispida]|uniref:protein P21-like n=1 Tax=Benincasa hispida TaxID=102211 RepID=UPI001900790D|nr:protein P21-like [Benincasa hispida]